MQQDTVHRIMLLILSIDIGSNVNRCAIILSINMALCHEMMPNHVQHCASLRPQTRCGSLVPHHLFDFDIKIVRLVETGPFAEGVLFG